MNSGLSNSQTCGIHRFSLPALVKQLLPHSWITVIRISDSGNKKTDLVHTVKINGSLPGLNTIQGHASFLPLWLLLLIFRLFTTTTPISLHVCYFRKLMFSNYHPEGLFRHNVSSNEKKQSLLYCALQLGGKIHMYMKRVFVSLYFSFCFFQPVMTVTLNGSQLKSFLFSQNPKINHNKRTASVFIKG